MSRNWVRPALTNLRMLKPSKPFPDQGPDTNLKYGLPLTGSDWVGLPLREGHWTATGSLKNLSSPFDTVLMWTGGMSQVKLVSYGPGKPLKTRYNFARGSGMSDLISAQTTLGSVQWTGDAMTCVAVTFPPACVGALTQAQNLGLHRAQSPQFGLVDSHIVDLMQRLAANASGLEQLGALYVQSLSLALISYVSAQYGRTASAKTVSSPGFTQAHRQQLIDFIEEQLATNFGLVDLSGIVAYSADHFSRLFKGSFGVSPHKYVSARRVERAKSMLLDDGLSISEIATACGFSSQAHLGDVFKRHAGLTPGAYRKRPGKGK